MRIKMDWDLSLFLSRQNYGTSARDTLENALTLTGHSTRAQALTCAQYMAQTWPATGPAILKFVQDAFECKGSHKGTSGVAICCTIC